MSYKDIQERRLYEDVHRNGVMLHAKEGQGLLAAIGC